MINNYDIKRKTDAWADGVNTPTWTVRDTRKIDLQGIRFSAERSAATLAIDIGGQSYVPSYRGFMEYDVDVTAADRITADSGTTDLLVLRVYPFEDHKEMDLKEIND